MRHKAYRNHRDGKTWVRFKAEDGDYKPQEVTIELMPGYYVTKCHSLSEKMVYSENRDTFGIRLNRAITLGIAHVVEENPIFTREVSP